jgi:glycosyltransferase involved in cell wall biosynthesis
MLVPELIRARSAWVKRIWIRAFERRNLAGANIIHVTSQVEATHLERAGLALAPLRIVPNGVELPAEGEGSRNPRQVIYLGRLSWKKNLPALIDAAAVLRDVRLVIAGPDDEGLAPALRAQAQERGLGARVEFRGTVEDVEKASLLSESACLVLPSLNENFGNVVAEAMAHGCPVVVTPDVGAREIVEASGAGIVAADVTATALATAIGGLLDDPSAASAAGEKGRRFVAERLTWPAVAARMVTLYDEARSTRVSSAHAR